MRFSTLLRKELRECLPWMLLAALAFLAFGGAFLRALAYDQGPYWYDPIFSPGTLVESGRLAQRTPLFLTGPWLVCSSLGLGLILGVRHFWIPHFTRTWPFLLHRSVGRKTILAGKLTAASIALAISLGLVWIALYRYACQSELFAVPQNFRVFIEGWIFIMLGFITYLGTTLSGLSTAKWYSTKIFGLALAALVIIAVVSQWRLVSAFATIIIGVLLLLSQIVDTFLNREF
jgi:hypothetical protein